MHTARVAHPVVAENGTKPNALAYKVQLERVCRALGVSGGRLSSLQGSKLAVVATFGEQPRELAGLEGTTARARLPQVIAAHGSTIGFYAGLTLPGADGSACMVLSLFDRQPCSGAVARALAAIAGEILAHAMGRRQSAIIAQQHAAIADFKTLEEQRKLLFDRASATAKMGIWQFNLAEQSLYWTAGVYDIFELPRQTPITREMIMEYYAPTSLKAMEAARSQAIHDCSDFSLNIEIRTAKGNGRWVRLTGAVEARNGAAHSIFGVKQDITDEKLLADKTRFLAENDVMTGLANRGRFQAYLDELRPGSVASLLLVDLDGFKQVNDTYGHAVGDACLKEAAKRLLACCPEAVLVSRIGGDEFAVLTNAACDRVESEALAQRIVTSIAEPVNCMGQALTLGASVGLAHAEGWSADDLFRHADTALYAAKAAGRNTSRVFRPS